MADINWALVDDTQAANIMPPGYITDDGYTPERCEAGEWGVAADADVVVWGSRAGLRHWAQSILDQVPTDRDEALVTVDPDRQWDWLGGSVMDRVYGLVGGYLAEALMEQIAADSATAGWTLGSGVCGVWAEFDGDLAAGVYVGSQAVGIGKPLDDAELTGGQVNQTPREAAHTCLTVIAARINASY